MTTEETIRRLNLETTEIETIDLERVINAYTKLTEAVAEVAKAIVQSIKPILKAYITYSTCSNNYRKLHGMPMRRRRKNAV